MSPLPQLVRAEQNLIDLEEKAMTLGHAALWDARRGPMQL